MSAAAHAVPARHAPTGSAVPRPRTAPDHVTPLAEIPVALRGTPGTTARPRTAPSPAQPTQTGPAQTTLPAERETPAPRSLTHSGARSTAHSAPTLAGRRVRADGVRRGPTGDPR